TPRFSANSRNSSPSPQPTSSTRAPRSTISATSSRSTRGPPPGVRAVSAIVRSCLRLLSMRSCNPLSIDRSRMCGLEPARLGGTFEETAYDREQLRLLQQEGIVSLVGNDLGERHARAAGIEGMH